MNNIQSIVPTTSKHEIKDEGLFPRPKWVVALFFIYGATIIPLIFIQLVIFFWYGDLFHFWGHPEKIGKILTTPPLTALIIIAFVISDCKSSNSKTADNFKKIIVALPLLYIFFSVCLALILNT